MGPPCSGELGAHPGRSTSSPLEVQVFKSSFAAASELLVGYFSPLGEKKKKICSWSEVSTSL